MHELGIVFHIAKMVENAARQNNVKRIAKVTLEIGEVSAIVNDYLEDCWNWNAKKSELLKDSKLEIINIKAVSYCDACHKEYETVKYGKICPFCGRSDTYLLRGNEANLKEIAVYDNKINKQSKK